MQSDDFHIPNKPTFHLLLISQGKLDLDTYIKEISLSAYDDALTELVNHYTNRTLIVSCTKDYT